MHKYISVQGAREHNLKNVNVKIPREKITIITGLSGSGKSSLAFDTIYAEGQRRYVESLSAYARQFLEMMQKPDVDLIEGLSPAIAIEQKTTSKNPRSTVGTVTEIYDYLRLLYARIGVPYSPTTGLPITSQTVSQMVDRIKEKPVGTKFIILAPIVRGRKGEYKKELAELQRKGFQRVKIDGTQYDFDELPVLDKKKKHEIDIVVDRIVLNKELGNRLADSLETALNLSDGLAAIEDHSVNEKLPSREIFSSKFACPVSGFTIDEIEPRLFSFNNPYGACPECDGIGTDLSVDPDLVIPNRLLTINGGAIAPWSLTNSPYFRQICESLAKHYKFSLDTPWTKLPKKIQNTILFGSDGEEIKFIYDDGYRVQTSKKSFEGVVRNLERRYIETESDWMRGNIERYQSEVKCPECKGNRLKEEALAVKIDNQHIGDVCKKSIKQLVVWFKTLDKKLTKKESTIAYRVLKELTERINFLNNVGLEYLTLSRNSGTLSGGESQRIRLASQIGSGLTGVLYVLDEPSIGLHQRDNARLLATLKRLKDLGNTVIVVEHDEEAMMNADYLIDLGPAAGLEGGHVVATGTPLEVKRNKKSLTGQYLSRKQSIATPKTRRSALDNKYLKIIEASGNNLKNVSTEIPLGTLTCVTGVSGSGKSTLTINTLYKAVARELNGSKYNPAQYKEIVGLKHLDKVIDIDQSPIGRTPRSNPATYTGAFTFIRDWFSSLPESKSRGYKPGRFSFNVKGGRCEACEGDGVIKIEMHFLPDVYVTCDECKGKRYNRETLEIKFKDKNISDILDMTVDEGCLFFDAIPLLKSKLITLKNVGLGYIKIGQQATTLSGGEAQRIKLSKELSKRATGKTLYILDEPTTGLHVHDIKKLLEVLQTLVSQGNTVVVIEHNLDVIKTADWVIDLGPEGGDGGGEIVAVGTPEKISKVKKSYTGQYLKALLNEKNN
ncbi:MAG: excinuclease ABC subunit UvrA [Candidatus Pelagibacterales bacterium]|jgi:excinuclease ABC subunit A|nr:excinuclease ABC subunit UvrA [Pelagibacterales bacterium]MBL6861866.1 excinuclease ABC subunit UvrA [Pelagibacterales bacterium]|tara:strand:- start:8428 stop:11277 length:2850 start_codon:yes stop_codon:yes gene_type:complete